MKRTAPSAEEASSSHDLIADNGKLAKSRLRTVSFLDYEDEYAQHGSGRAVYPG
jgi:hypothetical protein